MLLCFFVDGRLIAEFVVREVPFISVDQRLEFGVLLSRLESLGLQVRGTNAGGSEFADGGPQRHRHARFVRQWTEVGVGLRQSQQQPHNERRAQLFF